MVLHIKYLIFSMFFSSINFFSIILSVNCYVNLIVFPNSYNPLLHQIQCFNILKTGASFPSTTSTLQELPPAASILTPQLALPCTPHIPIDGSQIALNVLACLDSLTASREAGLTILESETQVQSVAKVYTKEDFSIVNRFEGQSVMGVVRECVTFLICFVRTYIRTYKYT